MTCAYQKRAAIGRREPARAPMLPRILVSVTALMTIIVVLSSSPHAHSATSVGSIVIGVSALQSYRILSFKKSQNSQTSRSRIKATGRADDYESNNRNDGNDSILQREATDTSSKYTTMTNTKTLEPENQDLLNLQTQAAKLREEAKSLQLVLQQEKENKIIRETEKVDRWIEELLIEAKVDENTELLKTVDQVLERLTEDRYSAEQVNKIFKRLCEIRTQESRSNCSPLMSLLVDAACKLDCMEREDNPNKRWNHKVERLLQKKLFARDWNIELDDEDDAGNTWKLW